MLSHPFTMGTCLTRRVSLCATVLVFVGLHTAAMAQSRLLVSTLKPPYLGKLEANQLIDNQNRVFAYLSYYDGIGLEFGFGGSKTRWVTKYQAFPASWPASTSASLSPTKLLNTKYLRVVSLSRNGSKLLINQTTPGTMAVYDTATRQPLSYVVNGNAVSNLGPGAQANGVNDQGWVAGAVTPVPFSIDNNQILAARWRPGQAVEMLPLPHGMTHASASCINAAGEVAGWVGQLNASGYIVRRLAKWGVDGTVQMLDASPPGGYDIVSIADNGTLLVVGSAQRTDGREYSTLTLLAPNGSTQALPIANDRNFSFNVGPHHLSPDGDTVIGSSQGSYGTSQYGIFRAFMFKDGVMNDLTTYATARGLKLPAGTHLSTVTSVNAQGTIAAGYKAADGKYVALKLTPAP